MNWILTGIFLAGEMAGAGAIALPIAVRSLEFYFGLIFMAISAIMATYCGVILGRSWLILQKHWPEYRFHCRDPYAQIGLRSHGRWMKIAVDVVLNFGMFCCGVLLMVIVSKNINDAFKQFFKHNFDYCYVAVIVTAIITPFCYLKSPQDFWWAIILGMVCTLLAVLFSLGGVVNDIGLCQDSLTLPAFDVTDACTHLGSILFAYGGHACFPTIQNDMKEPFKFKYSSILAYTFISILYFPLSIMANLAYNENLGPSVINNLQIEWIQQSVNLLITAHCMFAVILIMNPVMQTAEELLKAPQEFGLHRVAIRSSLMLLALVVVETFPEFGPLMGLLGGTIVSTTSFLFPVLFYLTLNVLDKQMSNDNVDKSQREKPLKAVANGESDSERISLIQGIKETPRLELICLGATFAIAFIVMVVTTIAATKDLATASFKMPCYLRWIKDWPETEGPVTPIFCCGPYSNISLHKGHCISRRHVE
ncbi:unnamed protein product [Bursaphelenchus xylophilus]|uniref:(pine wood nematode) hypothetical protein n=1 Tax=Bursaphelenchus xylophilus TaxID=6326 RepID=A0A1I7SV99_BURXY|nr:unnamed protein product [Bursaphelenchus xylophilus]CAG9101123.1 unnamed protein product [Bursaphelenchus xylophilus]